MLADLIPALLAAYLKLGPAKNPEEPVSPPPAPFGPLALVPLLLLLGLVLTVLLEVVAPERVAALL